jgi:short-subunit dehydrogenase
MTPRPHHPTAPPLSSQTRSNGCSAGTIINIGSIASYTSQPFWAAYSASKSALMSVTDAMRTELKPFGIKVVYCAPGELDFWIPALLNITSCQIQ